MLDAQAKPRPAADGVKDPRTATQRRHDALKEALLLVLRTGQLPASGGVTTTIVLTLTLDQYDALTHTRGEGRGRGSPRQPRAPGQPPGDRLVRTGHGALLDLDQAASLLGDARIQPVVLDSLRGIHAYGSSHRIFTEGQRLAMTARDHGCSFPGCTAPPAWCQAHHIQDWSISQRTSVDNGTLLCGLHHRTFTDLGYTCTLINGTPHWTAPPWLDPTQTPTRNTAHNPA